MPGYWEPWPGNIKRTGGASKVIRKPGIVLKSLCRKAQFYLLLGFGAFTESRNVAEQKIWFGIDSRCQSIYG